MSGNFHKIGNIRGGDGIGVPAGGQSGQALTKVGDSDFATAWANVNYADIEGKVPKSALPDLGNSTVPVDSEAAMLNLPAVPGNQAIRTDIGKTFVLIELPANKLENWMEIVTTSDVQSVNGQTGNVTLTKSDVGLGKVNNTADADKPVATASVNGLMPKADKAKLDKATANPDANALVMRNTNGIFQAKGINLTSAPSANNSATTKSYVDGAVASVAGGNVLSETDWDAMRTKASTGVVEGFVKGCPVGGAVSDNMSAGFVKDPVWRLEVRPEGLNYVTQRATLLSSTPKFMVGFAWERIYNPATAKWSEWACVAGDTGELKSVSKTAATATAEEPLIHKNTSATQPVPNKAYTIQRTSGQVFIYGETDTTDTGITRETLATGTTAPSIMWMVLSANAGASVPGVDYTLYGDSVAMRGVQQGSFKNRWLLQSLGPDFYAYRFYPDPVDGSRAIWLTFALSYPAPPVNTYSGGFTV